MRHCSNENPDVYEAMDANLSRLLRAVADHVDTLEFGTPTLSIHPYTDDDGSFTYLATLYVA